MTTLPCICVIAQRGIIERQLSNYWHILKEDDFVWSLFTGIIYKMHLKYKYSRQLPLDIMLQRENNDAQNFQWLQCLYQCLQCYFRHTQTPQAIVFHNQLQLDRKRFQFNVCLYTDAKLGRQNVAPIQYNKALSCMRDRIWLCIE